jgi:hypothetical protein
MRSAFLNVGRLPTLLACFLYFDASFAIWVLSACWHSMALRSVWAQWPWNGHCCISSQQPNRAHRFLLQCNRLGTKLASKLTPAGQHQPVESCLTAGGIRGNFVSSRANSGSHTGVSGSACAELASFE